MPADDPEGEGALRVGTHLETLAIEVETCPFDIHMGNLGYIQSQMLQDDLGIRQKSPPA